MVGTNAVRLYLGPSSSRFHPVGDVSLVLPYDHPAHMGRSVSHSPSIGTSVTTPLCNWCHVASILDFQVWGHSMLEYLLFNILN